MLRYSEASNFRALSSARESNLQPEVLSLFSGQQIGDYTKNRELSVTIPEHGYRAVVVISAQPSMMGMFEAGVGWASNSDSSTSPHTVTGSMSVPSTRKRSCFPH